MQFAFLFHGRAFFAALGCLAVSVATAATFGNVVTTVGGHPADVALDESRGKLYIANFTALRIDVMATGTNTIERSIPLTSHPSALAISPDSKYLVITEYQNGISAPQGFDGVTIINLATNAQQNFSTGDPALGVAFVRTGQGLGQTSGQAVVATSTGLYLLDPISGSLQLLDSISALASQALAAKPLAVSPATFPQQIVRTQLSASADGLWIWGVADLSTSNGAEADPGTYLIFRYDARKVQINADIWTTTPPLLPRVSPAADGSWAMIGWSVFAPEQCGSGFMIRARYPQALVNGSITGHVANSNKGVSDTIYAQIFGPDQPSGPPYYSASSTQAPTLSIMDVDNLTVRDRIYLPENLMGRAILDSAGSNMYAISDSGVMVLPVGQLSKYPRIAASQEDLLVQTNFCNRNPLTATFTISDPGNRSTDFSISTSQAGVLISPSSGTTPATVTVTVQPGAIPNPGGTLAIPLAIRSGSAVNVLPTVRLLVSNPDLDQRGTIVDIPGQLVDLLPDGSRNRFYVLRQDKNQVLVFDGSSYLQLAVLRTGTTPTGMSFTNDGKYLMVASKNSELIQVFDLDTLQADRPVQLPPSHFGMSVAQSRSATLALVENDTTKDCSGGVNCAIDRIDFYSRCAYRMPTLGIFKNDATALPSTTVLSPAPDQNSILVAAPNGNVMLYDASADTFVLARKDLTSLSGAYAASSNAASSTQGPQFPVHYVIGDNVFDASLVPQGTLSTSVGHTFGFTFTGAGGYRLTGNTASGAGVIQNMPSVLQATSIRPVRTTEAPVLASKTQPFTRTVAPLPNNVVLLTTSGVSVLSANYDAAVAPPTVQSVVSAANASASVAPGGLISVYGQQLSPTNLATSQVPLPTALAGSCLSVNGVPVPLLFVSGQQINAQLPFDVSGGVNLMVHTPGGVSDSFNLNVSSAAPAVFTSGTAGPLTGIATVVRAVNDGLVTNSNPVHPQDSLTIYLTGMGQTSPAVPTGMASPLSPLANAVIAPTVTLGGVRLPVSFAGLSPGMVGVYQINIAVPLKGVPTGFDIPLTIDQGGVATTMNVRVVD